MAAIASHVPHQSPPPTSMEPSNITDKYSCVKLLAESSNLIKSIPSHFTLTNDPRGTNPDSLPIIDFSLLLSANHDQRSTVLHDLGKACEEWGFFLVNHGIPETLLKAIIDASSEYFELPEEEKRQYETKCPSDPIKSGNSSLINTANHRVHLWRDFVKDILLEFSERTRSMARKLLHGIAEILELEQGYIDEALELDSSFQMFAANSYPPCPQPDQAIGIPPHTDPGLFTFLIDNGVSGLQIEHDGQWLNPNSPKNSILVHAADHVEIFSNGRIKSVKHRAVVNSERERISIVMSNGPFWETVVRPAAPLVLKDGRALYHPMKYMEFMDWLLTKSRLNGNTLLEHLLIQEDQSAN
ncbi:hypothetical protein DH2020_023261 [Rehmannia glutinosa]|uniref:Fe2OG dioxygenase domain-containing protein n=1 Tax=Rehmannia glutinosa TaxID=99300 RepID=A0ABR0W5J1_REHGL